MQGNFILLYISYTGAVQFVLLNDKNIFYN